MFDVAGLLAPLTQVGLRMYNDYHVFFKIFEKCIFEKWNICNLNDWLINQSIQKRFLLTYWVGGLHVINHNHELAICKPTKENEQQSSLFV